MAIGSILLLVVRMCIVLPVAVVAFIASGRSSGASTHTCRVLHFSNHLTCTTSSSTHTLYAESKSNNNEKAADAEAATLTPEKIGEMIEVTFVNGIMQLSQGYIDVLKLFIVACKAGYEQGLSMSDLTARVEACPVQSANRPLMAEELALRSSWMNIVYLVLQSVGNGTDDVEVANTVDEYERTKFGPLVSTVADAMRTDEAKATSLSLDDAVAMGTENGLDFTGLNLNDAMERAITEQCMRVIKVVFTVLEEERRCYEDGGAGPAPRPPIPGAFRGTN